MTYELVLKISEEYLFKFPPIYAMISSYLGIDNVKKFNSLKKKNKASTDVKQISNIIGTSGRDVSSLPPKKRAMFEKLNDMLKKNNNKEV